MKKSILLKAKLKKFVYFFSIFLSILFFSNSCDFINKSEESNLDKINKALENFRSEIATTLKEVALKNQMDIDETKFVFASPYGTFTSPIALSKELNVLKELRDFYKSRFLMLSFFNLPSNSEIPSGFYKVKIYVVPDTISSNVFKYDMIDMKGNVVLSKQTVLQKGQYSNSSSWGNRCLGVYDDKFGVRFGFKTPSIYSINDIFLGSGPVSDDISTDGQRIINSIKGFREKVEPLMRASTSLSLSENMLIITRDDKTAIIAGIQKAKTDPDGSIDYLYLYLKTSRIPAGFYRLALRQDGDKWEMFLRNEKQETVWSSDNVKVGNWSGNINGVYGGILDNNIHLFLLGKMAPSSTGLMELEMSY